MAKISGIIITKNEEEMLEDALKSLSFCDEIIIIDNYSTDKTFEIAQKYKAKVFKSKANSFSELRNIGKENAAHDYILYIDADERVDEALRKSILYEIKSNSSYSAYRISRKNFYLGENAWPKIEKLERLFKKEKLMGWRGEIHESPVVDGDIGQIDGALLHFTHRNLSQMLKKTIEWSDVESKIRVESKHPRMSWWRFPRVMITSFLSSYISQKGYKMGTAGLIESIYQSFSTFITYAKLWETQNKKI